MVMNDETLCRRLLPLLLTFLLGFAGGCGLTISSEKTYRITETELSRLESDLDRALEEKGKQKEQSERLRKQLRTLESQSEERKKALETVRKSFEEYAEEERKKQKSLRRERNAALGLVGLLAVALAARA